MRLRPSRKGSVVEAYDAAKPGSRENFSECVLEDRQPQPSGREGMPDVRVIEALYRSAKSGKPVHVNGLPPARRPSLASEIHRPAVRRPALAHAMSPGGEEE